MLYRETGQYKTSYAADMALFPIRQDRIGMMLILIVAFVVIPLTMSSFTLSAVMIPILIFSLASIGLNLLTGYTGLISLGTAGFMGVGAYATYKLTTYVSRRQHRPADPALRIFLGGGRRDLRIAVAAHQGLLSHRRDARRAVLPVVVLRARAVARELQRLERDRGADPHHVRHSDHRTERDAGDALSRRPDRRRGDDMDRLQYRARPHRPELDGGARHGYRGRTDRHPALPHQAARLRGLVVLLRRRRRADGVPVARRGGSRLVQHQSVLHHPVHGDHRRARQPGRIVLRRHLHLGPADPAASFCRPCSEYRFTPRPSSTSSS